MASTGRTRPYLLTLVCNVPKDGVNAPKGLSNVEGYASEIRPMSAIKTIGDLIVCVGEGGDTVGFVLSRRARTATDQEVVDLLDEAGVVLDLMVSVKGTISRKSTYTLAGLLRSFAKSTLVDVLAIVAHDDIAAVKGILVYMVDTADTDLLGEGNKDSTSALAGWGGLQNASVSTQNSAHKTYRRQHDGGGDGGVDAVKKREEGRGQTK